MSLDLLGDLKRGVAADHVEVEIRDTDKGTYFALVLFYLLKLCSTVRAACLRHLRRNYSLCLLPIHM
jgi:hypothetical protein